MSFPMMLLCAVLSYLLGSLNFGIIITKIFTGTDLRTYGSGNAGTTNAYRVLGLGPTVWVMLGDALKGVIAVIVCGLLAGETGSLYAFLFVILGHVFPLFYDFRGGKGILTAEAMVLVLDWRIGLILLGIFLVVVFATRYVSLGSCLAVSTYPVWVAIFHPENDIMLFTGLFAAMWIVILHRENIKRLFQGTENKFTPRKSVKRQDKAE